MKKIILFTAFAISTLSALSQKDVYFVMNHFLDSSPFQFDASATNNIGQQFDLDRVQYYISEIKLVHDGGQITDVPSTWLLVDAGSPVNKLLGNFSITNLEAIKFAVGVEAATNHLDPSTYPMTHPLAPQAPSMHWGWTSGYRFAALEGNSGSGFSQTFELHGLGDQNYFPITLNTAGQDNNGDLNIVINADYKGALQDINVASGPVSHGESGEAKKMLQNFTTYVFTSVEGNQSIGVEEMKSQKVSVAPNPSSNNIKLSIQDNTSKVEVKVIDRVGKVVYQSTLTNDEAILPKQIPGVYFVNITQKGEVVKTIKVVYTH